MAFLVFWLCSRSLLARLFSFLTSCSHPPILSSEGLLLPALPIGTPRVFRTSVTLQLLPDIMLATLGHPRFTRACYCSARAFGSVISVSFASCTTALRPLPQSLQRKYPLQLDHVLRRSPQFACSPLIAMACLIPLLGALKMMHSLSWSEYCCAHFS